MEIVILIFLDHRIHSFCHRYLAESLKEFGGLKKIISAIIKKQIDNYFMI